MKLKKLFTVALVSSALGLMATQPLKLNSSSLAKPGIGTSSLFERNSIERGFLKTNKSSFSASGKDWDEAEVTGSGLFVHLGLFFPPQSYMNPYGGPPYFGIGFDFEFGNYFRFVKLMDGQLGIGLRATWLSVSYTSLKDDKDVWRVGQISPLRVGPQVSYAINEVMGVDAFYQLGFNLTDVFGAIDDPAHSKDVGFSQVYTGISHEIGAAFHYKAYCLGLGLRMGQLANVNNTYDGKDLGVESLDDRLSSMNNFHITLGFRF